MSRYWRTENEDGTFTNEKCYTAQDMEAFAEWCSYMGWLTSKDTGMWWNRTYEIKDKTTTQLREIWEKKRNLQLAEEIPIDEKI